MRVLLDTFWAPKRGNSVEEYEDAFAPNSGGVVEGTCLRFAVADGATDAAFSGLWARLLVEGYRKGWIGTRGRDTHDGLQRLGHICRHRVARKTLPWYAEEKRRLGAFAALLGLELSASEADGSGTSGTSGTWRSYSVGDCCLFHLRGDRVLGSFPLEDPEEFGSRPVLLSSNADRNGAALASAAVAWGDWLAGDEFFLMSDALACWFLTEERDGDPPWQAARELGTGGAKRDFLDWTSYLRARRGLRNDDVTLLRIAPV